MAGGNCVGWAARDTTGKLSPYKFNRRSVGADDVHLAITYAGMCHRYALLYALLYCSLCRGGKNGPLQVIRLHSVL